MNKLIIVGHLGVGGQRGYVFRPDGVCPCLSATQYKDPTKIVANDESNTDRKHIKSDSINEKKSK